MKKKIILNVLMVLFIASFGAAVLYPAYSQYDGSGAFGSVANWVKGYLKSGLATITASTVNANTVTANAFNSTGTPYMRMTGWNGVLAATNGDIQASNTSSNLAAALSDETGTGSSVFSNNPTFPENSYFNDAEISGGYYFDGDGSISQQQSGKVDISDSSHSKIYRINVSNSTGTLKHWFYQNGSFANAANVSLPDATYGFGVVKCGVNFARFEVNADGTTAVYVDSGSVNNTQINGNVCVYDGGTNAILENRLGTTNSIVASYYYY